MDRRTAISTLALCLAAKGTSAADVTQATGGIKLMVLKVRADVANFTAGTTLTRLVCKLD